jgi:hypothetical protein
MYGQGRGLKKHKNICKYKARGWWSVRINDKLVEACILLSIIFSRRRGICVFLEREHLVFLTDMHPFNA